RRHTDRLDRVLTPFRPGSGSRDAGAQILRRDLSKSSIKPLNELLHKVLPDVQKFRRRLRQASRTLTMDQYLLASLFITVIVTAGIALFLPWPFFLALLIGILVGIFIPYWFVAWKAKRRQKHFLAIFPDAIDIIVRAVRSGQPASEAIRVVGDQAPEPVSGE